MTLAGTDIVELLEGKLPSRFGGLLGDNQLVEEEHADGNRLILRVHPRAGVTAKADLLEAFMN
jgi:hypothetical protein